MTRPILLALTLYFAATPVAAAGGTNVGPARCIACHQREGDVWKHSKHFRSFEDLRSHPKTKDLLTAVGETSFTESTVCAHCHLTVVPDLASRRQGHAVSGPSCESCHGPASDWLSVHVDPVRITAFPLTDEQREERRRRARDRGMHDHSDLFGVAKNCVACHGLNHPLLDGETLGKLLASGHSIEPSYDMAKHAQGEIRHRFYPVPGGSENMPRSPAELARLIIVAQVARLISARDGAARSKDAGYRAAQLQRAEMAREALSTLASWPPMAAFLEAPSEARARVVVAQSETADPTTLVKSLLPHLVDRIDMPSAADRATKTSWVKRMLASYATMGEGFRSDPAAAPPPSLEPPSLPSAAPEPARRPSTADEALEMLLAGNLRFVAGRSRPLHQSAQWRQELTKGQHPYAAVLSCSDSRVPVELVFDQGFGDLFVIRVAGNVFAPDTAGSILYAAHHLHTKLLFVMGHESCGAVTAAMGFDPATSAEPAQIKALLGMVAPSIQNVDPTAPAAHRLSEAIKENVRLTIKKLREDPEIRHAEQHEGLRIVGGVYRISTGEVYRITEDTHR